MPASVVNLDALIRRDDFEVKSDQPPQPAQLTFTLKVSDLNANSLEYQTLRKPDFQRETSSWGADKIVELVRSFLDGDLIPAVILWRSPDSGNIFVIDGAHRLGALIAWVHDDYGDNNISQSFFGQKIPKEQLAVAEKTRQLMRRIVGSYQQLVAAGNNPQGSTPDMLRRAKNLGSYAIQLQWVNGDARKAESSFFKINQEAAPIDEAELKILESRNKPNALTARAIIRAGSGHQYWAKFTDRKDEILSLARHLHDNLFTPALDTPVKTLDLPIAGKVYTSQALPLLFDMANIINDVPLEQRHGRARTAHFATLADDVDGSETVNWLKKTRRIVDRISSTHPSSLGLHPAVYFYSDAGRHQPSALLAVVTLMKEFEASDGWVDFMHQRRKLEDFLISYKNFSNQIVSKLGSGRRSYQKLKQLYTLALGCLGDGKTAAETASQIQSDPDFSFIKVVDPEIATPGKRFSTDAKSQTFLTDALKTPVRCKICTCLIHPKALTIDHILDRRVGGMGSPENAQLAHPFCNSTFKDILARAAVS